MTYLPFQVDHETTPFPPWAAFNWTASYRVDATIHTPYGMWMPWADIRAVDPRAFEESTGSSPESASRAENVAVEMKGSALDAVTLVNDINRNRRSSAEALVNEQETRLINDDVIWR